MVSNCFAVIVGRRSKSSLAAASILMNIVGLTGAARNLKEKNIVRFEQFSVGSSGCPFVRVPIIADRCALQPPGFEFRRVSSKEVKSFEIRCAPALAADYGRRGSPKRM